MHPFGRTYDDTSRNVCGSFKSVVSRYTVGYMYLLDGVDLLFGPRGAKASDYVCLAQGLGNILIQHVAWKVSRKVCGRYRRRYTLPADQVAILSVYK